jgi:hypothetical protein
VPASVRGDLADERGEGLRQHDGLAAEPESYFELSCVDVVEGEAADRPATRSSGLTVSSRSSLTC